jgi:hypothetical protein
MVNLSNTILKRNILSAVVLILSFSSFQLSAQLSSFTLSLTPTNESCPANGYIAFNVTGQTAGSTIVYSVYKSPNYTTAIGTTTSSGIGGLVAGYYKVVATQTLGSYSNSQIAYATVNNSLSNLAYTITKSRP